MHLSFCVVAVSTITLIVSSTLAPAAEVRVLSDESTQIAAKAIATEFEKETGHKVLLFEHRLTSIRSSRRARSTPSSSRCRQWIITMKPAISCQ